MLTVGVLWLAPYPVLIHVVGFRVQVAGETFGILLKLPNQLLSVYRDGIGGVPVLDRKGKDFDPLKFINQFVGVHGVSGSV